MKRLVTLGIISLSAIVLVSCSNSKIDKTTKSSSTSSTKITKNSTTTSSSTASDNSSDVFVKNASDAVFTDNVLKGNSYSIKITDYKIIQPEQEGNDSDKPIIVFFFDTLLASDYDNSTPITPSTAWILNFKAVQDNDSNKVNTLENAIYSDEELEKNSYAEIKPGGTVKSAEAYTLSDTTTPVKLIAETIDHAMGEQTYKID